MFWDSNQFLIMTANVKSKECRIKVCTSVDIDTMLKLTDFIPRDSGMAT